MKVLCDYIIQRKELGSGGVLHDGSQITHRIKEIGDTEGVRSDKVGSPLG